MKLNGYLHKFIFADEFETVHSVFHNFCSQSNRIPIGSMHVPTSRIFTPQRQFVSVSSSPLFSSWELKKKIINRAYHHKQFQQKNHLKNNSNIHDEFMMKNHEIWMKSYGHCPCDISGTLASCVLHLPSKPGGCINEPLPIGHRGHNPIIGCRTCTTGSQPDLFVILLF